MTDMCEVWVTLAQASQGWRVCMAVQVVKQSWRQIVPCYCVSWVEVLGEAREDGDAVEGWPSHFCSESEWRVRRSLLIKVVKASGCSLK